MLEVIIRVVNRCCCLTTAALFSTPGQAIQHKPQHRVLQRDKTAVLLSEFMHHVLCFAPEHHLTPEKHRQKHYQTSLHRGNYLGVIYYYIFIIM